MTDLEKEAREAAHEHSCSLLRMGLRPTAATERGDHYELGYLAAATARDQEIATLRARVAELEAQLDRTKLPLWILREEVPVEEIAAVLDWELGLDYPDTEAISLWLATVKG